MPPPKCGKRFKPYIRPVQFNALVNLIAEPYAPMIFTAVYTGLRVSKLVGLRWRNVDADSITVDERYCRGDWGAPKSEARNATVGVNSMVIGRIQALKLSMVEVRAGRGTRKYRAVTGDAPDDLVFQSWQAVLKRKKDCVSVRAIQYCTIDALYLPTVAANRAYSAAQKVK